MYRKKENATLILHTIWTALVIYALQIIHHHILIGLSKMNMWTNIIDASIVKKKYIDTFVKRYFFVS